MVRSTIQVTLFSILGIAINFIIQLLLSYYFGATQERDAYFAALTIPTYLTLLFTGSIGMMLLPFLVRYQASHTQDESIKFTSEVINFCFVLMSIIVIAGCLLAYPIMHTIIPDSKPLVLQSSIFLFRIQLVTIIFTVSSTLLAAVFQASHSFLIPSLFPIISSVMMLIFIILLSKRIGISSAVYGTLAGAFLSFLFMWMQVFKRFHAKWYFSISRLQLNAILAASFPLFAAGVLFRSTNVFERFFAARLPQGSLSYLGTSNQIIAILSTLVSSGIATTSFPLLSKYWSTNDIPALEKAFSRVVSLVSYIIFPMVIIFAITGTDIIHLVFERGAFNAHDTSALYCTLLAMMGFLLFSSLGNILIRILYLSHKTIAVALIATAELAIYISSALILTGLFQYVGLGLSMSIASCCNIVISFIFIRKKVMNVSMRDLFKKLTIIFILSVCIFLLFFFLDKYFFRHTGGVMRILINTVLVLGAYVLLMSKIFEGINYRKLLHI